MCIAGPTALPILIVRDVFVRSSEHRHVIYDTLFEQRRIAQ